MGPSPAQLPARALRWPWGPSRDAAIAAFPHISVSGKCLVLQLGTAMGTRGSRGTQSTPCPRHPPAPRRGRVLMALPGCGRSLLAHKTPRRALRLCPQHIRGPHRSPASLLKPERGRQSEAGPLRAGFGYARQGSGVPFPVPIYFHSLHSQPSCRLWCGGCSGPGWGRDASMGAMRHLFLDPFWVGGMQPGAFAAAISVSGFHRRGVNAELRGSALTSVLFMRVNLSGSQRWGSMWPGRRTETLL